MFENLMTNNNIFFNSVISLLVDGAATSLVRFLNIISPLWKKNDWGDTDQQTGTNYPFKINLNLKINLNW